MSEVGMESPFGRKLGFWGRGSIRVRRWLSRARRKLPYLVWHGDELDVRVTFRDITLADPWPLIGNALEAEKAMRGCGINFDAGLGYSGRDWEWDFSLSGPISVVFLNRATRPDIRTARPRPKLVVNNPPSPSQG